MNKFQYNIFYETEFDEEVFSSKEFENLIVELKNNKTDFEERVARNLIYLLDYSYHKLGISYVSDKLFENFENELKKKYQNIVLFNKHLTVHTLPYHMPSLDKIYNTDFKEIEKFIKKFCNVIITSKLDGVSCLLIKKNNKTELFTKGDGENGRNISHILKYINIDESKIHNKFVLRGELIIKKENSKFFSGEKSLRSKIIGIINRDYKKYDQETIDILKYVDIVFYSLYKPKNFTFYKQFNTIREIGLNVVKNEILETDSITQEILEKMYERYLSEEIYDIDGLVIADNDKGYNLGKISKPSEIMFAFKQDKFSATTTVIDILWQKNKKGIYYPVILHNPIKLDKNVFERVTGHNAEFIKKLGLGIGSEIKIVLRGDVIPKIDLVLTKSKNMNLPTDSYWKGLNLVTDERDNTMISKQIEKWFIVFELKGISHKTILNVIEKLEEYRIFSSDITTFFKGVVKFFKENSGQYLLGEKKDIILKNALKKMRSSQISIISLFVATDLFESMNMTKLKTIFNGNPDLYELIETNSEITENHLMNIHGIGEVVSKAFLEGIKKFKLLKEKYEIVFNIDYTRPIEKQDMLKIVFTEVKNKDNYLVIFKDLFRLMDSVSRETDFLVVPNTDFKITTKYQRAEKLGIKIIKLEEFLKIMNGLKINTSL